MAEVLEEKSWDHLVSDEIVYRRYVPTHSLQDWDPGPVWRKVFTELDSVGVKEDDGLILTLEAKPRGPVAMDRGRELSEVDATSIEEYSNERLVRFLAYDFRIVNVEVTDGPAARRELMQSNEQKARSERTNLSGAIDRLTEYLGGNRPQVSDRDVIERLQNMPTSQVEALLDQMTGAPQQTEAPEEEAAREAKKARRR